MAFSNCRTMQCRKVDCGQDGAPCLSTKNVQVWFAEQVKEFRLLSWPADSSDLNQLKLMWDVKQNTHINRGPKLGKCKHLEALCDRTPTEVLWSIFIHQIFIHNLAALWSC